MANNLLTVPPIVVATGTLGPSSGTTFKMDLSDAFYGIVFCRLAAISSPTTTAPTTSIRRFSGARADLAIVGVNADGGAGGNTDSSIQLASFSAVLGTSGGQASKKLDTGLYAMTVTNNDASVSITYAVLLQPVQSRD